MMKKLILFLWIISLTPVISQSKTTEPVHPAAVLLSPWIYISGVDESAEKGVPQVLETENPLLLSSVPAKGADIAGGGIKWESENAGNGVIKLPRADNRNTAGVLYLAFYINVNNFTKGTLSLSSCFPYKVFMNGKKIMTASKFDSGDKECKPDSKKEELSLEQGAYYFLIQVASHKGINTDNQLKISFESNAEHNSDYSFSLSPALKTSFERLLDDAKISNVTISPDGKTAAVFTSYTDKKPGKSKRVLRLYDVATGTLKTTLEGSYMSQFAWAGKTGKFSYVESEGDYSYIYIYNPDAPKPEPVLGNIKNLSYYRWDASGKNIWYAVYEKEEDFKNGVKRYESIEDRPAGSRSKNKIWHYSLVTGLNRKVAENDLSCDISDISPDGKKLLFYINKWNDLKRPFSNNTYYIYDSHTGKTDSVMNLYWSGKAAFLGGTEEILILGGPSLFGKTGIAVPDAVIPNEYDSQAYIYNLKTGAAVSLTKTFNPSVSDFHLTNKPDVIFFSTVDRDQTTVYAYSRKSGEFRKLPLKVPVVDDFAVSDDGKSAVYSGSSASYPEVVYISGDLSTDYGTMLFDPSAAEYKSITPSKFMTLNYTKPNGEVIDGLLYLPDNFDSTKKYPAIVYYYGGTTPVENNFEGRYPKNIWTANGYIVYVIQPSGAIGYGQEFSSRHVNDWGTITGEEITGATKAMINSCSFIDPGKIGCIGASYGGFMTMSLITKTDIFAAAISHAGISSLSSYWGEGYWGVVYSGIATAESYPWNRKDIYVDKSPLFNADKVNTPILLLHGNADTNVPPGESAQFYSALKLLGKDVEYIEVDKQNHHIIDREKRELWSKTILAYFDKYLKDKPEWWNHLYGKK
ncbi:MAG: prolyl oligopeptidase family serine peptidase [Ignavibacteriaceae bacterium]|nr:prolyl oligopeptidase family serine peptidase [Ignavibacteriaceae bacterium]